MGDWRQNGKLSFPLLYSFALQLCITVYLHLTCLSGMRPELCCKAAQYVLTCAECTCIALGSRLKLHDLAVVDHPENCILCEMPSRLAESLLTLDVCIAGVSVLFDW